MTTIIPVENKLTNDLNNFIISDFMIDLDDFNAIFKNSTKYSIKNTSIKINVIKLEDERYRVSSVLLFNKDLFTELCTFDLLEKIEVDHCQIVILNEDKLNDTTMDDWLESCISMKELYNVLNDGKICISSGFGVGIYRINGSYVNDELVAIKIEFIKESID
jgi:hypothetical protein